jgi:AmmeMemoRadiSam system protein B/AmmeMemoRadiSam system protein A
MNKGRVELMKKPIQCIGVLLMCALNCSSSDKADKTAVRQPAVAGQFYSDNPAELRSEIQEYLSHGKPLAQPVRMLISPHAGYVFSGPVAAMGYASVSKDIKTVILIGPSHYVAFTGLSIPDVGAFETPLGTVPLAKEAIMELRKSPLVVDVAQAHWKEHSLEVQIPFLQVVLPKFAIVPIVTGKVDAAEAAKLLVPLVNEQTLVVASSDFSHYQSQQKARSLDDKSIKCILTGDVNGNIDACGEMPIRIVMNMAKTLKLTPKLIDARTSYETAPQHGGPDRVVGYASIVYVKETGSAKAAASEELSDTDKHFLITLARESLEKAVRGEKPPKPGNPSASTLEKTGCFVTLTKRGELRGCIGYIEGIKPLYEAVIDNAQNAALSDPRFPQVKPSELKEIKVEVSVLTRPQPLEYKDPDDLLNKLVPGVDGIILQKGFHQSTFLPQVWDQLPDKVEFLEHLSLKGGMPQDGWKSASVKRYRAIHFEED